MNLITLPPQAAIEQAANEMDKAAVAAQSVKRQIAVSKAAYDLLNLRPEIIRISSAYLIPSTSQAGVVYRVDDLRGCNCPAGLSGKECRHKVALEIIEVAQQYTLPAAPLGDRLARARAAADAFNSEIFA